ncbi:MAG: VOC family protein [Verrucomicrobiales bacterium]|nr:VOC family protein [Verrucomicrobiales bacterium]
MKKRHTPPVMRAASRSARQTKPTARNRAKTKPSKASASSYPTLSPGIAVHDAAKAIDFYKEAFGAVERYRLMDPESGKIGHAEITIKGALIMLADEYPAFNKTPKTLSGTPVKLCLMSRNVDADFDRAIKAGADVISPVKDQFYGHRSGCLRDPFGHEWTISKEVKKISPKEMQRRWNEMGSMSKAK